MPDKVTNYYSCYRQGQTIITVAYEYDDNY